MIEIWKKNWWSRGEAPQTPRVRGLVRGIPLQGPMGVGYGEGLCPLPRKFLRFLPEMAHFGCIFCKGGEHGPSGPMVNTPLRTARCRRWFLPAETQLYSINCSVMLSLAWTLHYSADNFRFAVGYNCTGAGASALCRAVVASDCVNVFNVLWCEYRGLSNEKHWIGLYKESGTYKWYDGATQMHQAWDGNEPTDDDVECFCYTKSSTTPNKYVYDAQNCTQQLYYICKKDPGAYTSCRVIELHILTTKLHNCILWECRWYKEDFFSKTKAFHAASNVLTY